MLPGFSANSSVYRSRQAYGGKSVTGGGDAFLAAEIVAASGGLGDLVPAGDYLPAGMASMGLVLPALPSRNGGGSGNGDHCKPSCGSCLSTTASRTGCAQSCTTVTCDTRMVPCNGCASPCKGGKMCSGVCTLTSGDPRNCGSCGHACLSGETCQNGACVCSGTICNSVCTNLQTDANNCGSCGNACGSSQICCNGTCTGPVAAPGGGLASNSNYFFDSLSGGICQNIVGLTVTLEVTEDMASDSGFSIQLNANSAAGTEVDAWQQYGFGVSGNSIQGFINNWANLTTAIVCNSMDLCSTPINNGLPAGYVLSVTLNTDSSSNVTGAVFQVFDNNGNQLANKSFSVAGTGCNCSLPSGFTCTGFKSGDLSPMTAFTVDVVGNGGGSATTFSAGAGNITYSGSSGQLTPLSSKPACVESVNIGGTAETSNAAYGTLNGCPRSFLTQPFSVTAVTPRTCFSTNGPCTGAGGSDQCKTLNGVTQCCHSNWLWGWFPWIRGCSDGTIAAQGCGGPCY
jgi:hypothetical protein